MEDYSPQRVPAPGITMLTQPSLPTQQNISLLASSCFAIILRVYFSDHSLSLSPKKCPTFIYSFFLLGVGSRESRLT